MAKKSKHLIRNSLLSTCALAGATLMPSPSAEAESYRYQIRPSTYRSYNTNNRKRNPQYLPQRNLQRVAQALANDAAALSQSLVYARRDRGVGKSLTRAANRFATASAHLARDLRHSRYHPDEYDYRVRKLDKYYEGLERRISGDRYLTSNVYRKWSNVTNAYRRLYDDRYHYTVNYQPYHNRYYSDDYRYRSSNRRDCDDEYRDYYYYDLPRIKNRLRRR